MKINFLLTLRTQAGRFTMLLAILLGINNFILGQSNTGLISPSTSQNIFNITTAANGLTSNNQYVAFTTNGDAAGYGGFTLTTTDGGIIPNGASILGIEVLLEGNRTTSGGQFTRDLNISLTWDNGISYTTAITMTRYSSSTDATITVGGSANLWGHTWLVSELTKAKFGIKCIVPAAAQGTINLDFIQIRVYYLCTAPSISTHPSNQTANVGSSVTFSVTAAGTGLTYQWRKGTTNITGANNANYTINPVAPSDAAINYNVLINGACGTITSNNASLILNPQPLATVTNQTNLTCFADHTGTITILASGGSGTGYTFSVDNGQHYEGSSNPYTFTGLSANNPYRIRVKDSNGSQSPAIP